MFLGFVFLIRYLVLCFFFILENKSFLGVEIKKFFYLCLVSKVFWGLYFVCIVGVYLRVFES